MHPVAPRAVRSVPLFALALAAAAQAPFTDFASGPVAPLRLSADGLRLFAVDTTGGQLVVFDLRDPSHPLRLREIPVGLEPVAVNARTADEVWVVNQLSDSVSIVSLAEGGVVATLPVVDEPSDVVFAAGKAFVTAATRDQVQVFDAVTRQPLGTVAVPGKDPRALATSPDGSKVYAVVQRSGNGTTLIPEAIAPLPPPPTNPLLPAAPRQGVIVRADDPAWAAQIPFTLPDHDVVEIDAATLAVSRTFTGVGTTNTAIAVHPQTGALWVANTEARNLVRFEPNVRGHAIDSRLTRITTGATPTVTAFDLNPGLDYTTLPNPAALATALSEPFGVAVDAARGCIYTAAHGSDRIGVLDLNGNVLARIDVAAGGPLVDPAHKRGPRGLALHPTADRLYVLNRLSDTLMVIDTASRAVLGEQPLASQDPMPAALRQGRNFLHDARLSGNGTMSCASCHIDGDLDGLAWDLGNPAGNLQAPPAQPFPFSLGLTQVHPMKGPRTTQTLRGIGGTEPLHWGGDRASFAAFNPAFASLLGGSQLTVADMNLFAGYATQIAFPPNPNQPLDRSYLAAPAANNQAAGLAAFQASVATVPLLGNVGCTTCHALPTGSNRMVISAQVLQEVQQMKVPQLRNLYRKTGFVRAPGPQKAGFGYTKDGAVDTLTSFLALSQFNTWPAATKDDIATFLLAFDTGTAPCVGHQVTVDAANANSAAVATELARLTARAATGEIELVARGRLDGRTAGLLWQPATATFTVDRTGSAPLTLLQLTARAAAGTALLTFTGVPPGSGPRLALDRDLDGVNNGDEDGDAYGTATAGCSGALRLLANSEPRLGNVGFAFVTDFAPANGGGVAVLGLGQAALPVAGITVLVDPTTAAVLFAASDARGTAVQPLPVPANAGLVGLPLYMQSVFVDACAAGGLASSRGLSVAVRGQ